ncbi:hypothetical protein AgCh_018788 [Apium graveolens]
MPRKKIRKIDADDQVIEMLFDFSREENDSNDVLHSHADQKDYTILNRDAIEQRQDDDINNVANSLSISRAAAIILLCHYNWSVSKSCEKWFDDEEKIRKSLGLLEEPVPLPSGNELRCPLQSCGVAVGEDMINALATPEDKEKYRRYLRRSFIEDSRKRKWCPAPECNNAVEFIAGSGSNDVLCDCSCSFCWKCMEEAHWPVGCDIVSRWFFEICVDSVNMNRILVEEKPCPTCRRPIKWNQGSIAVRCSAPCKYQFCWSCLRSWAFHGEGLFVFRACNQYRPAKEISEYGVTNECRGMAKDSVERYSHYYYRWATNETREKFIIDAWLQIVECRKVLKWTYVYGYYLADDNLQQIFEDVQGRAEYNLEELHQYAELELKKYLEGHGPSMGLNMLRDKLIRRTCVTGKLFKDLIYAIEHDLEGFISCMASHPAVHPASKRAWKER